MEKTIFIAGSRDISGKRLLNLFKRYHLKGKIVWGVYRENYISGFDGQPQFRTLNFAKLEKFCDLVKDKFRVSSNNFEILEYSQDNEIDILENLKPEKAIFINGSWKIAFHRRPIFEFLKKNNIEFSLKSPFEDEEEAKEYEKKILMEVGKLVEEKINKLTQSKLTPQQVSDEKRYLEIADIVAMKSFDYTWQTGAILVRDGKILLEGHNRILPFETYAMLHGSLREKNMTGLNDLNNYDTLHAEMDIVSQALQQGLKMKGATLYINLMPCPNCARMLAKTGISRIVCRKEHFGGFARELFESMKIKVVSEDPKGEDI